MEIEALLKTQIRDIPDFPSPGIMFRDITPLLSNPSVRTKVIDAIVGHFQGQQIQAIAAIEARGFIFGSVIAQAMNLPFVPIRKAGKLPFEKIRMAYDLEYGQAVMEMHTDAVAPGTRMLIHDDLLATGGTASAAGNLVEQLKGVVAGYSFIINLAFLPGEKALRERFGVKPHSLVNYH